MGVESKWVARCLFQRQIGRRPRSWAWLIARFWNAGEWRIRRGVHWIVNSSLVKGGRDRRGCLGFEILSSVLRNGQSRKARSFRRWWTKIWERRGLKNIIFGNRDSGTWTRAAWNWGRQFYLGLRNLVVQHVIPTRLKLKSWRSVSWLFRSAEKRIK